MDRKGIATEVCKAFNTDSKMDTADRLSAVGATLLALEVEPTELEWRKYLQVAGINIYEADSLYQCIEATCLFHYGNLLTITDREEDTWIHPDNPASLIAVADEEYAAYVDVITDKAESFRKAINLQ